VSLVLLLFVPVVVGVVAFFLGKNRITALELAIQVLVVAALLSGGWYLARWTALYDNEIWNGRVASKQSGTGRCCHSYKCNCRESCNSSGTCSETCSTCYEHSHDEYWDVTSTNGETVWQSRCNPPGSETPARWLEIRIGEPTAHEHLFTNYVKADPMALLGPPADVERFRDELPEYPRVTEFHADRFLFVGVSAPDAGELLRELAELNADLGAKKEVNAIVIVVAEADPAYFEALHTAWLGGKKNDVVLVIGTPSFPRIAWTRVMAWNAASAAEDDFKGMLAESVLRLGTFDGRAVLARLRTEIEARYTRRSFAELAWLLDRATPTPGALAALTVFGLVVSGGFTIAFWLNRREMDGATPGERVAALWRRLTKLWRRKRRPSS
jgi:hypothetical protein